MSKFPASINPVVQVHQVPSFDPWCDLGTTGEPICQSGFNLDNLQDLVSTLSETGQTFSVPDLLELALPPVPHFYSGERVAPILNVLNATALNGGRLVLRGTRQGVGTSALASDFVRVFNISGFEKGFPDRIIYMPLNGIGTARQLIDALAEEVGLVISPISRHCGSFRSVVEQFVAAGVRRRATTIVLDHLELASDEVKIGVMDLMLLSDPRLRPPLEPDKYAQPRPRFGFVLVTNQKLKSVFKKQRRLLTELTFGEVLVKPFTDVDELADTLRRAGRGFESLDVANPEDRLLVQWILEVTEGRITFIAPLMRLMEFVAMLGDDPVATLVTAHTAFQYHRRLREEYFGRKEQVLSERNGFWTTPIQDGGSADEQPPSRVSVPANRKARIRAKEKEEKRVKDEQKKLLGRKASAPRGM